MGGDPNFGINGGVAGTYGTLGMPAAGNFPGTRWQDATWKDANGNLWLFGGQGYDSTGANEGILNDLWKYDPAINEWTWMGGSSAFNCADVPQKYCHMPGVYGNLGQPSPGNIPGSRYLSSNWKDNEGNFWLFGGIGFDSVSDWSYLNDLWQFNPTTDEWTWMGGSSNVSVGSVNGVYGTKGLLLPRTCRESAVEPRVGQTGMAISGYGVALESTRPAFMAMRTICGSIGRRRRFCPPRLRLLCFHLQPAPTQPRSR